jgi:uncharacterized protein YgbK (DUF1537 family)
VLFDTLTCNHLETIGELICDLQREERKPQFVAGSSGMDYALVKHWQVTNEAEVHSAASHHAAKRAIAPADRVIILSGSCSPVTKRQIDWAIENGFADVPIDVAELYSGRVDSVIESASEKIVRALDRGQSVVAYTSRGCKNTRLAESSFADERNGANSQQLGEVLARILRELLQVRSVKRVAVVGGDTAGQFAREAEIEAVEMTGPLEPGAPLCVVRSKCPAIDCLEITFKGGQVGYDDFFATVRSGQRSDTCVGAHL